LVDPIRFTLSENILSVWKVCLHRCFVFISAVLNSILRHTCIPQVVVDASVMF